MKKYFKNMLLIHFEFYYVIAEEDGDISEFQKEQKGRSPTQTAYLLHDDILYIQRVIANADNML